jgi:hypothetical protein
MEEHNFDNGGIRSFTVDMEKVTKRIIHLEDLVRIGNDAKLELQFLDTFAERFCIDYEKEIIDTTEKILKDSGKEMSPFAIREELSKRGISITASHNYKNLDKMAVDKKSGIKRIEHGIYKYVGISEKQDGNTTTK